MALAWQCHHQTLFNIEGQKPKNKMTYVRQNSFRERFLFGKFSGQ